MSLFACPSAVGRQAPSAMTPAVRVPSQAAAAARRGPAAPQRVRAFVPPAATAAPAHAPVHTLSGGATAAAGGAPRPAVSVTFRTVRKLAFGEVLRVVGSAPELGRWDCARAPRMEWSEGDRWTLTLDLGPGSYEFKVAVANGDRLVAYEDGPNRTLTVPEADAQSHKAYSVNCEWGSVASWLESLLPGDKPGHKDFGSAHHHTGSPAHAVVASHDGSPEGLRAEVAELRRQLAARSEEAAAFSRACEQLRSERDAIAAQLASAQQQLSSCQDEKARLAAAAAKSEKNIQLLRQVGQLLSNMHDN